MELDHWIENGNHFTTEPKCSTPAKLIDLEEVINTRTPIWDIGRNGDVRIKLDTDVNGQEWYVISPDDGRHGPIEGIVSCWAFPHWNGDFETYAYVPVAYCFKTFAALLDAHPTERAIWGYNEREYDERRTRMERHNPHAELKERMKLWGLEQIPLQVVTTKDEEHRKLARQDETA